MMTMIKNNTNSHLLALLILSVAAALVIPLGFVVALEVGTEGGEELYVDEADNIIRGEAGDDEIYGDITNDALYGQNGTDQRQEHEHQPQRDHGLGIDFNHPHWL